MKVERGRSRATPSPKDPLDAVPVPSAHARSEPRSGGGVVLVLCDTQGSNPFAWLSARLGFRREKRFELDAVGASYWAAVDGAHSLAQIHAGLCQSHELSPEAARRSVIEFTAALMRRGLIGLEAKS